VAGFDNRNGIGFSFDNTPAAVLPQYGLISVTERGGAVPVEEIVHNITINRRPQILFSILQEHWSGTPAPPPLQSIIAHQPLLEALNDVYLQKVDQESRKANIEYGQAVFEEVLKKEAVEDDSITSTDSIDWSSEEILTTIQNFKRKENKQKQTAVSEVRKAISDQIGIVLDRYIETGLFRADCAPETESFVALFLRPSDTELSDEFERYIAYQVIESMLFRHLRTRGDPYDPPSHWAATVHILQEYQTDLSSNQSPFPFQSEDAIVTMSGFIQSWMYTVVRILRRIGRAISEYKYRPAHIPLISSLPSVVHLLHPFVIYDYHQPTTSLDPGPVYPWMIFNQNGFDGIVESPISRSKVENIFDFWDGKIDCSIYSGDDADIWLSRFSGRFGPNGSKTVEDWISAIIEQIVFVLQMYEQLWNNHHENPESHSCQHCVGFFHALATVAGVDYEKSVAENFRRSNVAQMLGDGLFSGDGKDILEEWGDAYLHWFEMKIDETEEGQQIG
jgi:hypothetical protein